MRTFVTMLLCIGTAPAAGLRVGLGRNPALPTCPCAPPSTSPHVPPHSSHTTRLCHGRATTRRPADRPPCPMSHRRAPTPLMNGRFGFGKPPAPPQSSSETFLSSKPNNQELVGYFTALSGALAFVAKVLEDDLKASASLALLTHLSSPSRRTWQR